MRVTLHVYPKLIGDSESADRVDLFIVVDDNIRPWQSLRGFSSEYRIKECLLNYQQVHDVKPNVIRHEKPYYVHLPRHGNYSCC